MNPLQVWSDDHHGSGDSDDSSGDRRRRDPGRTMPSGVDGGMMLSLRRLFIEQENAKFVGNLDI